MNLSLGIILIVALIAVLIVLRTLLSMMEDVNGLEPGDLSGKAPKEEYGWGDEEEDRTRVLDVVLIVVGIAWVITTEWFQGKYRKFCDYAGW